MIEYTKKQRELMELWRRNELARINLLEGSVRSGKTWISLVLWAFWVSEMPKTELYLMCGKTLTTLKRNCLLPLQGLIGEKYFSFSTSSKEGKLFGRTVMLEGANDARSEEKIRGITLQGAYCDELTLIPEDFFTMLLSRLSVPGAKLFATTNPGSPNHWLLTNYIQRSDELNFFDMKFVIDDNTTLDPEYVRNIKAEFVGVFYDRFILGKWVLAEGLVYPMYDNTVKTVDRKYEKYLVSMDYGTQNPTAMILFGLCGGVWYAVKEYYHSGRETNDQKTTSQYHAELVKLVGDLPTNKVIVDPSATPFIAEMNQKKQFKPWRANNDVIDGIQHTAQMLADKKIMFNDCCKHTIEEFGLYSWDDRAQEDTVIKENDHCLTGDTLVETLDGPKRIDELAGKRGFVYCTDGERVKISAFDNVRMTRDEEEVFCIKLIDGRTVSATKDHLFLTRRWWIEMKYLTPGDAILCMNKCGAELWAVEIKSITPIGKQPVYNLEVEDYHNFAVNGGIIVHNCMDAVRYMVNTTGIWREKSKYKSVLY